MGQSTALDYSLVGENSNKAVELGLAEADWYTTPLPREALRGLLARRNGPAIRDTLLLVVLLVATGWGTVALWGSWWAVLPYMVYAVLYGTSSDSRWHECGHGTAFKSDWLNTLVYEVASFMVMRESVVWRWSHTRHHSDTIIVGRDPEIQVPRPPDLKGMVLSVCAVGGYRTFFPSLLRHACGKVTAAEKTFIPESEYGKVYRTARFYLVLYAVVIGVAVVWQSWLPIFLFVLPQFFGTWLMIVHNTPQHAGLAENVLDHRLNCRTVYMNPISRFIYWNMNYHVEHHMFPLVPYHALPRLHEAIKDDCPPPYPSIVSAWREILPAVLRQVKDPAYHVKRELPAPRKRTNEARVQLEAAPDAEGWIDVCAADQVRAGEALRVDRGRRTYAVYRNDQGRLFATDGICTHGNTHLADGLVIGDTIECPKHNGRFALADGAAARAPVCRGLRTFPVEERGGRLQLNIERPGGAGARPQQQISLRVARSRDVATFIRELELEPTAGAPSLAFTPGDYLQIVIPDYGSIAFKDFDVDEPYAEVWRNQHVFDLVSVHPGDERQNNYSLASNPNTEGSLRFNVRIATPPPGQDCPPGVGSAYIYSLKPGDTVTAIGPFGDFHIKPTKKEMVYIGGGAGMAPIRSHISQLLETENSMRRIHYWYGARSRQELFYQDYFEQLQADRQNFQFQVALSAPLAEDAWTGHSGLIHEVVREQYLKDHANLSAVEFYLCGPPKMVTACRRMLEALAVREEQVSFDEF